MSGNLPDFVMQTDFFPVEILDSFKLLDAFNYQENEALII
jgi:hypothetical protein